MLAGSGFHAALEYGLLACMEGKEPTEEECINAGIAAANAIFCEQGIEQTAFEASLIDPAEMLDEVFTRIRRAAGWYLDKRFHTLRPLHVEREFDVELPDTDGWRLTGRIDLTEDDGRITDFKLSGRAPKVDIADTSVQLTVYALAVYLETGELPPSLALDYTIDTKRVHGLVRESTRTEKDVLLMLRRIQALTRSVDSGIFIPASRESYACTPDWCPYYGKCQFTSLEK